MQVTNGMVSRLVIFSSGANGFLSKVFIANAMHPEEKISDQTHSFNQVKFRLNLTLY